jgi:hypothetical protein
LDATNYDCLLLGHTTIVICEDTNEVRFSVNDIETIVVPDLLELCKRAKELHND